MGLRPAHPLTLLASLTGESLHWDEVGFAVPRPVSEVLDVAGLAERFHYTFADLKTIPTATEKLSQIYAIHLALAPILLLLLIILHYYLIKVKGYLRAVLANGQRPEGAEHGPGGLGFKPTFPISWTHGMNVFFAKHLGIEPDI